MKIHDFREEVGRIRKEKPRPSEKLYNFFVDNKELWESLIYSGEYGLPYWYIIDWLRFKKRDEECLAFIEDNYNNLTEHCKYDYSLKAHIQQVWSCIYIELGNSLLALEHAKEYIRYTIVNNVSYDGFEFLSFRTCSDFTLNDIENHTISLSPPSTFNDPVDTPIFQWLQYNIDQNENNKPQQEWFKLLSKVFLNVKARCFVRNKPLLGKDKLPDKSPQNIEDANPLMWAHYADSHKGLCIKYKFKSKSFTTDLSKDFFCNLFPIQYKIRQNITKPSGITFSEAFLSKGNIWHYEHEHRMLFFSIHEGEYKSYDLQEDEIVEIYLGVKCSYADE